jgi:hypothetical protein
VLRQQLLQILRRRDDAFFAIDGALETYITVLRQMEVFPAAIASGDFAAAGSLTRSRAQATPWAIRAPRSMPARSFALLRPSTSTRASFDGLPSDLYARNW